MAELHPAHVERSATQRSGGLGVRGEGEGRLGVDEPANEPRARGPIDVRTGLVTHSIGCVPSLVPAPGVRGRPPEAPPRRPAVLVHESGRGATRGAARARARRAAREHARDGRRRRPGASCPRDGAPLRIRRWRRSAHRPRHGTARRLSGPVPHRGSWPPSHERRAALLLDLLGEPLEGLPRLRVGREEPDRVVQQRRAQPLEPTPHGESGAGRLARQPVGKGDPRNPGHGSKV